MDDIDKEQFYFFFLAVIAKQILVTCLCIKVERVQINDIGKTIKLKV